MSQPALVEIQSSSRWVAKSFPSRYPNFVSTLLGRDVVVRQVEVRHAAVEGPTKDRALGLERTLVAEIVPQAE